MHTLNKLSACILTGTLILSGMTSSVKADEPELIQITTRITSVMSNITKMERLWMQAMYVICRLKLHLLQMEMTRK